MLMSDAAPQVMRGYKVDTPETQGLAAAMCTYNDCIVLTCVESGICNKKRVLLQNWGLKILDAQERRKLTGVLVAPHNATPTVTGLWAELPLQLMCSFVKLQAALL